MCLNLKYQKASKKAYQKAFSLIELIFVIVILGIIASVAIPKLTNIKTLASSSSVKQDINTIVSSVKSYYLINGNINAIEDSVSINSKIWSVDSTNSLKITHIRDGVDCVVLEVDTSNKEITVVVDSSNSECSTLVSQGISSETFDLE